jgi:hypothetical protein
MSSACPRWSSIRTSIPRSWTASAIAAAHRTALPGLSKAGEEAVARGVELSPVTPQLATDQRIVPSQHHLPTTISKFGYEVGRPDDVCEQEGREDALATSSLHALSIGVPGKPHNGQGNEPIRPASLLSAQKVPGPAQTGPLWAGSAVPCGISCGSALRHYPLATEGETAPVAFRLAGAISNELQTSRHLSHITGCSAGTLNRWRTALEPESLSDGRATNRLGEPTGTRAECQIPDSLPGIVRNQLREARLTWLRCLRSPSDVMLTTR